MTFPLRTVTLFSLYFALPAAGHSMLAPAAELPNIVLVMADDQGWGDVGFRDHPYLKTPVMDEMAAKGIRFDRFYAAAPVCSPTRGSVLTGRHPNRFGCFSWGHPLREQEKTVAEYLQQAGYTTGHFGKWHLGSIEAGQATNPGQSGFDRWVSAPNFFENHPLLSDQGRVIQTEGESSKVTVDLALSFIRKAVNDDQPFFAVVWFGSPHAPHESLEEFRKPYGDLPKAQQQFLGEIAGMDHALGELRTALRELQVADNTLLWYCSDNGALPVGRTGGLRGKKSQLWEGGIRVPAMIEWPDRFPHHQSNTVPCTTSDILPTLLDAAGVEPDPSLPLDGQSLLPLLEGKDHARDRGLGFWVHPTPGIRTPSQEILAALKLRQEGQASDADRPKTETSAKSNYPGDEFPGRAAWIAGDWKLHRIPSGKGSDTFTYQLYHLDTDPAEKRDVASWNAKRIEQMRAALEAWQKSVVRSLNGRDYD
jgi:arylsulfatase A-like enzyme